MDFVTKAKAELLRLKTELASDPRSRRISHLEALLKEYEQGDPDALELRDKTSPSPARSSQKQLVRNEIVTLLRKSGQLHRSAITWHLIEKGVIGSQRYPQRMVAVYLSNFEECIGDGRGNWRLIETS